MHGEETAERQYSEYSRKKLTQREPEYDQDTETQQWELSKSRKKKSLVKESNPMYFKGVRTIKKSDSAGSQTFGQPWPDGPDGSGPRLFTNTAVPSRVVTRYGSPKIVCTP